MRNFLEGAKRPGRAKVKRVFMGWKLTQGAQIFEAQMKPL